jgi:MoxR-like ATPase
MIRRARPHGAWAVRGGGVITTDSVGDALQRVEAQIGRVIIGQQRVVEQALCALLADGHILIEGVPGIAKTLLVRVIAQTLGLQFRRVQFTPDLMPSDLIGTTIFDAQSGEFRVRYGPIFANIVLADEVNRTPPKTQSALLEAMEERKVTIDGVSHALPRPFMVFATQNPIEYEGTYPLPEAQLDRFLLKVVMDYPAEDEERAILRLHDAGLPHTPIGTGWVGACDGRGRSWSGYAPSCARFRSLTRCATTSCRLCVARARTSICWWAQAHAQAWRCCW